MKPRKFNEGDVIGGWTLIEYPPKSKKAFVRCQCGFEAWRWLSNFSTGTSKSCPNCRKTDPRNKTYKMVLATAKRRGLEWALTYEQWLALAEANCHYCGSEPSNFIAAYGFRYNGVDRVDSSGYYTPDNTVTACRVCNRAKSDMTTEEFLAWVRRVSARVL